MGGRYPIRVPAMTTMKSHSQNDVPTCLKTILHPSQEIWMIWLRKARRAVPKLGSPQKGNKYQTRDYTERFATQDLQTPLKSRKKKSVTVAQCACHPWWKHGFTCPGLGFLVLSDGPKRLVNGQLQGLSKATSAVRFPEEHGKKTWKKLLTSTLRNLRKNWDIFGWIIKIQASDLSSGTQVLPIHPNHWNTM